MAAKGTFKVEFLKEMERGVQSDWEKDHVFEEDAPQKPDPSSKYMVTFPFPYMNGLLHLGHTFTITRVSEPDLPTVDSGSIQEKVSGHGKGLVEYFLQAPPFHRMAKNLENFMCNNVIAPPILAVSCLGMHHAWQLRYRTKFPGTFRRHSSKPFPRPDAPDDT